MENRYGVDVTYFEAWNDRIFNSESGLTNYKPDELARELARMSRTADSEVLKEPEFNDRLFNQSELDQRIAEATEQACREQREKDCKAVKVAYLKYLRENQYRELVPASVFDKAFYIS